MLNFTPSLSRLRARLTPAPPLLERAAEVIELEPERAFDVPPAISLPGEIDRVQTFAGETAAAHFRRLTESVREEGPALAYRFDDATVADFTVYASGAHQVYRSAGKRAVIVGQPQEFAEAQLCATPYAETYFGHFLREVLPLELLARGRGLPPLTFEREPWLHEDGYRELLGLPAVRTSYARVRTLWLVDESPAKSARRIGELRRRIREQVKPVGASHVFLLRGPNRATRNLVNEEALADELEHRGFQVIEPEKTSPASLCAALAGARVITCVEGSAQNHAFMAMPPGATLLSIQPPHRFNAIGKLVADAVGVRFAFVVAEPQGDGFQLDAGRFMRTLDLLS